MKITLFFYIIILYYIVLHYYIIYLIILFIGCIRKSLRLWRAVEKKFFHFFFFTKQEGIGDASQQLQCNFLVVLLH